jgi:hypothetical protein
MNIYAKKGDKVVFSNPDAGYAPDQESAQKHLEVGKIYTVKRTIPGSWRTTVILKEVPSIGFNSCLFDDINGFTLVELFLYMGATAFLVVVIYNIYLFIF